MPKFRYVATTRDGLEERGVLIADSKNAALAQFNSDTYRRVRISRAGRDTPSFLGRFLPSS